MLAFWIIVANVCAVLYAAKYALNYLNILREGRSIDWHLFLADEHFDAAVWNLTFIKHAKGVLLDALAAMVGGDSDHEL